MSLTLQSQNDELKLNFDSIVHEYNNNIIIFMDNKVTNEVELIINDNNKYSQATGSCLVAGPKTNENNLGFLIFRNLKNSSSKLFYSCLY